MQDQPAVLSSWKEIASFFGKGVRTVQRWERTLGLPIHRPEGAQQNIVFARTEDLRNWLKGGKHHHTEPDTILVRERERMRFLMQTLASNAERLHRNSMISRAAYAQMMERRERLLAKNAVNAAATAQNLRSARLASSHTQAE